VWAGERRWVKLAFEVSPQREPMVVSVVTDGLSDDANAFVVPDDAVFLRVSRLGSTCALHARLDGGAWRFVRYLALAAPDAVRAGFLVQAPIGDGATARFDEIDFVAERLADLRSGV
jgi:regulation of enolase protein 1 (concanavalin A-like superfamily)